MSFGSSTNKPKYELPQESTLAPSAGPSSPFRRFATRVKQVCQHILPASPSLSSVRSATPSFDASLDSTSPYLAETTTSRPPTTVVTTSGPNRLRKRSRAQRRGGSCTSPSSTNGNKVLDRVRAEEEDDTLDVERSMLVELARERIQYQVAERRRTASSSLYSVSGSTAMTVAPALAGGGKEVDSPMSGASGAARGGSGGGMSSLFRRSATLRSPLRRHQSCHPIHQLTHKDVSGYHDDEDEGSVDPFVYRRNSSSCPSLPNQRRPVEALNEDLRPSPASSSALDHREPEEDEANEINQDSRIDEEALFFSPPLRHCSSSLSARASATSGRDLLHYSDARTPPLSPSTPTTAIHSHSPPFRLLRPSLSPPSPSRARAQLTNHYPRATKRPPFSLSLPSFGKRRASMIRNLKLETVVAPTQSSRATEEWAPIPPSLSQSSQPSSASASITRPSKNRRSHSLSRSRSVLNDEDLFGFGINQLASTSTDQLLRTRPQSISLGCKTGFARLQDDEDEDDGKDEAARLAEQREWHQKLLKFAAGRDSLEL
ncbi:BQ2448_7817 [Microbotryum intermedium]|uniref:BQ2448_7817 protein n=1 Tax=Microbotryum intermedium TaxID=269621 RepID=A0A238FU86_9BASI|nr:BQ2448_7817 [Microbotryum intermedium]